MTAADSQAGGEKRRASLISLLVVIALIALKITVGLVSGSLAVMAQAADSVLDLVATILAFFAVRVAEKPPDRSHPYGHGKVENLAALAETLLLLATCGWIAYEAVRRLLFKPAAIESGLWAIAVMVVSIVVSLWLSTYLMAVAHRQRSQSLEGNALNFRTDVLSSSAVLLGLVLVQLGQWLGPEWSWLGKADPVVALLMAIFVAKTSLQLGWRSVSELLDAAPPGLAEQIRAEAEAVPGVLSVEAVRVRQSGAATFVDLTAHVRRSASLERAHQIASAVEQRVGLLIGQGDVVVHVDPVQQMGESLPQAITAIAARLGLQVHNIHAHQVRDRVFVDLDVEVSADLTLAQAHEQASWLEAAVYRELPYVSDIHTHIEPLTVALAELPAGEIDEALRSRIIQVVEKVEGLNACPKLYIRPDPEGLDVVLHCLADPDLPIAEAHRLADLAEKRLQAEVPDIAQVHIHLEPQPG